MVVKKRNVFGLLLVLVAAACSEQSGGDREDAVYEDELHRPGPWSARVQMVIAEDTLPDEEEKLPVLQSKVSSSFEDLIDQVYHLAFSGDVPVYGPDLFGEPDKSRLLNPEALVYALELFDTITVEDIHTGALRDTVVNVSFTRKSISAVAVFMTCHDEAGGMVLNPYAISIGKQVFSESTGALRGVAHKFFVELESGQGAGAGSIEHRLYILSDSNGIFHPAYFGRYDEGGETPLQELLGGLSGQLAGPWQLGFNARFDYATHRLFFEDVRLTSPGDVAQH